MLNGSNAPFFVVGMPRSGTKLLRGLLNNHDDIWIPDVETNFIPYFAKRLAQTGLMEGEVPFESLAKEILKSPAFWYWSQKGLEINLRVWRSNCQDFTFTSIVEGLFKTIYQLESNDDDPAWDKLSWGDKSPSYIDEIDTIAGLFPAAKFIHIVRDPRDYCLSMQKAWGKHPIRSAQRWADSINFCRSVGKNLKHDQYLELRYEDLLDDSQNIVNQIFEFLGLTKLDHIQLNINVENLGDTKGETQLVSSNKNKFLQQMPSKTRYQIERITGDTLASIGYFREFPNLPQRNISRIQMKAYKLADTYQLLRFSRKEWGSLTKGARFLYAQFKTQSR